MLFSGKGGTLLSGYNFNAKGEKAQKYQKYLLKRCGFIVFVFSTLFTISLIFGAFQLLIPMYVIMGLTFLFLIAGIIYLNTNYKVKRAIFLAQKLSDDPYYEDEYSRNDNFI